MGYVPGGRYEVVVVTPGGRNCEYRDIRGIGDVWSAAEVATQLYMYHDTPARVARLHVGYEIAQRVYREMAIKGIGFADIQLYRLDYMWVTAYDHVDAMASEEAIDAFLSGIGQQVILVAPVYGYHEQFGSGTPRGIDVELDSGGVDIVNNDLWPRGDTVGAVGVVEEAYLEPFDFFDQRDGSRAT